ncbi:MAG TPA: HAMP domain-containing sensor histidine kinase [Gemmatimonadaceae bacterium]|jgi:signal transduction histidine kinase|nr:HAMP domain-containing sensor histidine kinase [Gemmatimonadaceae bacterium]
MGQSTDANAEQRVGLGLLSRFIGAVFLVLLGGLLLLDRALVRANKNLAALDAQSGALLTEAFVSHHDALLDRIAALVAAHPASQDSGALRVEIAALLQHAPAVRRVWVVQGGQRTLAVDRPAPASPLPPALVDSLDRLSSPARSALSVTHRGRDAASSGWILLTRAMVTSSAPAAAGAKPSDSVGTVGLVIDGEALRGLLLRTSTDSSEAAASRRVLMVLAGADTVTTLDAGGRPALGAESAIALARLPSGGRWTIASTHALATRSQRWGMLALGIGGMLFLAIGLLREQQRALHVAARSLELERLYSDVKRANQAKSEFLANVSHELRTPLNAIVGFVELLRDGFYGDLSPRQVPPVDRIAASATHLRHLVDQVLDIAKIAAGRLEVHTETIVLRPFVLNVASELESLVSEKGLALSITVGASLPRVRTDPTHLRQILINLIGNAVKYTATGSVSVRARLLGAPEDIGNRTPMPRAGMDDPSAAALLAKAPRSGIWIALQVIDTGVGIAPSDLARIFDEFEQVNAGPRGDSMQRGTGLGLAISRRLARLLAGDISVESVLGRGSTFTIWLPVSPADLARERPVAGETVATPAA